MKDRVALDVRDNGAGFDLESKAGSASAQEGGFGLGTMRERVERLGGTLSSLSDWLGPDYKASRLRTRTHKTGTYSPPVIWALGADLQCKRVLSGWARDPNVKGRHGKDL